jgi:hypothetical protein
MVGADDEEHARAETVEAARDLLGRLALRNDSGRAYCGYIGHQRGGKPYAAAR